MSCPVPYDFQRQDIDAVLDAHMEYQCVLGVAATGLGKAIELAFIAQHYARFGRVLVLVDVKKLVRQLADDIELVTGQKPGIEMADERADHGDDLFATSGDRIIVSTVQTQYSGPEGKERFTRFQPSQISCLLLDETELFLAPQARAVVDYYIKGNPALRVLGVTATPIRTDGTAMAELFEHVAFCRDILWGIDNGYLVPGRQAFVRVSLDASTLKVRRGDDGESDYSEEAVAKWLLQNESAQIELAQGILTIAEQRRSIVVCPNVASAKAVTHYLCAERDGCARVLFGEMTDDEKDSAFDGHQAGEFQFLVSVMMCAKGYNDPQLQVIFNCRKTQSKRLYAQILGRGTRPLKGILVGLRTPEERKAAIAASDKREMTMVNMVGVNDDVRDITLIDILGHARDPDVIERAKLLAAEGEIDGEAALNEAEAQLEQEADDQTRLAELWQAKLDREIEQEEERRRRRLVQVKAEVQVEYRDDLSSGGGSHDAGESRQAFDRATAKQVSFLVKLGVLRSTAERFSKRQASAVIAKKLAGREAVPA